jgi:hypothetical protein
MLIGHYLISYAKITSMQIKDPNIIHNTIKLLEENIREEPQNVGMTRISWL